MKRLSIEEWKKRDNPFKKKSKVVKQKTYAKQKKFKHKVKPIRDNGVVEAAKLLADTITKKIENQRKTFAN